MPSHLRLWSWPFGSQLINVLDKVLHLFCVPHVVLFGSFFEFLKIGRGLTLPDLPDLFHDIQGWYVRHRCGHLDPRLSDEEHVGGQRFLGHLVQQGVIADRTQLGELFCEPVLISFGCILVFLPLLLVQLLPLGRDHLDDFCDPDARVLRRDDGPLLVTEEHVGGLGLLERNIFLRVERLNLRKVRVVDLHSFVMKHRFKTVAFCV